MVALPWWRPPDPLAGRQGLLAYAPSGLAQAVAGLPAGARVVTPQTWGSWFEWAAPDARYFIDSRFELFPAEVWADYETLRGTDAAAAAEVLDRWQVDVVVVPAGAAPPHGDVDAARERHRRRGLHEGPLNGPVPSGGASAGTSLVESRPMRHEQ